MPDENQEWRRVPTLWDRADENSEDAGSKLAGLYRQNKRQHRQTYDEVRNMPPVENREVADLGHLEQERISGKDTRWQSFWSKFAPGKSMRYIAMAVVVLAMITVSFLKPIDQSSESQLDSALTRALIGFGIARTLNGVISVAQGTEFAVQPAGVGVNFSPGEILDPVNDLVERFSWVMLLATSSLGIQKILLEVSSWVGISFMLAGAGFFWLMTRWRAGTASQLADIASRVLLIILLLRFLIPLGSLANDWVYRQFLQPRFEASSLQLEEAGNRIREINTRNTETSSEADSLRQKAKNLYQSVTSKFDFDGMLDDYKESAESITEHAVNLIVVFILQTVIFPLLFLYMVYRLFRFLVLPGPDYLRNRT